MKDEGASAFYAHFRERLLMLRQSLGYTQPQMAKALGVSLENYKKYERRNNFPLHCIEQLALVTHRDIEFLITGRNIRQFRPRAVK